jgi:hypothetical protein
MQRRRRTAPSVHELRDAYKNTTHLDGAASIPFPEIVVELEIPEREVLRWAKARARGKTIRPSRNYLAYAIEVERRYRQFDWTLYCTSEKYRDAIFDNARRGA